MANDLGLEAVDGPDPSDFIMNNRRRVMGEAITSLPDDPAKVARSYELGRATGDAPALIYANLDNYEEQHKSALTAQLLSSNQYLREYIDADPMHAKISNDDWANLDDFSSKLSAFRQHGQKDGVLGLPARAATGMIGAAWEGFHEGIGQGVLGDWISTVPQLKDQRFLQAIGATAGLPIEIPMRMLSGGIHAATKAVHAGAAEFYRTTTGDASGAERFARDLAGMAEMQLTGVGVHSTPIDPGAIKKAHDALISTKLWLDHGREPPAGLDPTIDKIKLDQNNADIKRLDEAVRSAQSSATRERDPETFARFVRMRDEGVIAIDGEAISKLYGDKVPEAEDGILGWSEGLQSQLETARATGADVEVPIADFLARVDPEVYKALKDDIRVRPGGITKNEAKLVGEQKDALEALFSIDPETIKGPAAQFEGKIYEGITHPRAAEEALKAHGKTFEDIDKVQGLDAEGFLTSTGRYVSREEAYKIAIAAEQLTERTTKYMRGRESLDTIDLETEKAIKGSEAREEPKTKGGSSYKAPEILPEDLPQMRAAAGLEPLFSIGDRKLKLETMKGAEGSKFGPEQGFHDFQMMDEMGRPVGYLNTSLQKNGSELWIDMISGIAGHGPRDFGYALMRDIFKQLREEFPEIKTIAGHRISGAREKLGTYDKPSAEWRVDVAKLDVGEFKQALEAQWESIDLGLEASFTPTELLTSRQREIGEAIQDELARLTPKQADVSLPTAIRKEGTKQDIKGVHTSYTDRNPFIIVALDSTDPIGTARHEAIHHLRQQGFFTEGEWNILTRAARDNGWIEKFGIERRYAKLETSAKLEEAIADGFRDWKAGAEVPKEAATVFERLKELFESIKARLKEVFGREVSWEELFQKVDEGEVGGREGNAPRREGAYKESVGEPDLPETTRMEDRPLFRTPATIGMTEKQVRLYERRLRDMQESDTAHSQAIAEKEQRKRLTADWKAQQKEVRAQVEEEMNTRPDVAADLFFGRGELYGEKLDERPKINWDDLTPEQRAQLPEGYVAKKGNGGVELDDVASLVGYPSGEAMIQHLTAYNQTKLAANMSAKAFRDRMVDLETERQMTNRHGDLEENILDAVKDQVTSETQLNLIGEEVLALGIRNNAEATINKAELKAWVQDKFAESLMAGQSSDKFLKAAGKGGQAAEIALLKGEFDVAYRAKQQQFLAMMLAKEARSLEKEQKQFAKTAQRLGKRDVKGLAQEYQDVIQMLMWQAGLTPKRTMVEIQRSQAISDFAGMDSFVESAKGDGWVPDVDADIIAGRVTQLAQMTVEQFRDFKTAIDSLAFIGRQVEKIDIAGQKEDFAAYKAQVIGNITTLPLRPREAQESGLAHRIFSIDATLTRMENIMKDLDLGEDMGPLVNAVIRPLAESKHKEYSLQEGLSKQIKDLNAAVPKDWKKSLNDTIPNDWFHNPIDGNLFKLSRSDMINIMLNWGNKGNRDKFARSYGSAEPGKLGNRADADKFIGKMNEFFDQHATREDWKFVQGIWDIYKSYRDDMDVVWRNTSGTQPRLVESIPVDTPHGQFDGGYYPLIRDQYMSPLQKKGNGEELFGPDYPNFSTPQGHLKERTGAAYYVDFQSPISRIPMRMQQVIHDIAYRAEIMATAKVIRDGDIQKAISNHYGREYTEQLEPWLKKTARGSTFDEANQKGIDSLLRQTRLNLVAYALPWNYVVTLTPDVGSINPKVLAHYYSDKAGNDALAHRLSKEIPHAMYNMDRDFKEAMQRAVGEGRLDEYKAKVARWGYGPVSWASKQFRTATFVEKFNEARGDGKSEADAAAIADTYVRERHGAVALHDMPSVMTTGEKGRLLTMFYGYFNTQYNLARTVPGHLRRGEEGKAFEAAWGSIIVGAFFGATVANQAKQEDTWLKRGAKAIPLQLLGMVPFAREAATLAIEGIPPRTPWGSLIQAVGGAGNDISKYIQGKPIESGVKHLAAVSGLAFGIPGTLQAGRTGQFLWDVNSGKQRPRDIFEWTRGIMTGEARLKHKGER